jgi:hypothetical protein
VEDCKKVIPTIFSRSETICPVRTGPSSKLGDEHFSDRDGWSGDGSLGGWRLLLKTLGKLKISHN